MRRLAAALLACAALHAGPAAAVRVKDIANVKGVRQNQIVGYGLVVGLNGTGDKQQTQFTVQSLASMLARMGIPIAPGLIQVKNVAAVMVTAMLPPFSRAGSQIDAVVSSIGDSSSLEGGTLLVTPLYATDGQVYAIAQGPLSVGGFSAGGSAGGGGTTVQKNHPTVGRLAGGATVERELGYAIEDKRSFELALATPDFTTALRVAGAIDRHFGESVAAPVDAGTLRLTVPANHTQDLVRFLAEVEGLDVQPDTLARVVLNERTGTVVMGGSVRVSTVAVAHGSLSVTISTTNQVSQPTPLSLGSTVVVQNQDVSAVEEPAQLAVIDSNVTIGDLARALNAMGVTPRDLIAILQAIKTAGALSAELEVM
jgi:flagellar P-ring protein precursor FlgI